jgi:hypothetical protein
MGRTPWPSRSGLRRLVFWRYVYNK